MTGAVRGAEVQKQSPWAVMTVTSVSALQNPLPPLPDSVLPSFGTRSPPTVLCKSPALASKPKKPAGRLGVRLGLCAMVYAGILRLRSLCPTVMK